MVGTGGVAGASCCEIEIDFVDVKGRGLDDGLFNPRAAIRSA
jgi:hypothetical protein